MTATTPDITVCLKRIGKDTAGWDTLVVAGAADTVTRPEDLWAAWSDLERWPLWSPLHRSVTGTPEAGLAAGASFDQHISLGFPIGTTAEHATFDLLEPGRRAAWTGDANGIRNCHLWSFTPLARRRDSRQQHRSVRRLSSGGTAPASHPPMEPPVPGRGRWPHRPGIRCPERLVPVNIRQERATATRDHPVGTGLGGRSTRP